MLGIGMNNTLQWIWANGEWLLIGGGIALVSFIVFIANRISAGRKPIARGFDSTKNIPAKNPRLPLLFETNRNASLYRTKDKAYLMLHVLIVNEGNEMLIIRTIEATMGNGKGLMVHEKFTATATHSGRKSSFSFGSSENLLPLSMTGNASNDAYLCFAFSNADIEIGDVALKVSTSKGKEVIPLQTDVTG